VYILVRFQTLICVASERCIIDEGFVGKDLEGRCYGLIEVLACYMHGRTEVKHAKPLPEYPISQPRPTVAEILKNIY
jgi:hypothetical protein